MPLDTDAVETIAFDSYGTLVDPMAVEEPLAEHVDSPGVVATLWRNRSLGYVMVGNHIDEYDSFYEMNRRALEYALDTTGQELDEETREEVLATYHELPTYDDVHEGLERLSEEYDLYVVSNGSEEMLESMVDHGELGEYLTDTVSADEIERFKPAVETYEHAADRLDTPAENVCFVAGGWWDVPGAVHAGMQGVWINRLDTLWGPYETEPDLTIDSFHELADELGV